MSVPFKGKTSVAALVSKLAGEETPLSAMIEIADRCNEKCVHCYQVQGQKGEMTTEEIFGVLDELAEMGVLFLTISGGEATLRKDFLDIVAYARKKKFAVKIYTNGLKVTRELASKLGELAVQEVQISLYSSHANVHDWVTNVPGSWEKTTSAARYLVDAGVKVVLKTPVMRINEDDSDAFVALCEDIGADYSFDPIELIPREDGDRSFQALSRSEESYRRILSDPALAKQGPKGRRSKPPMPGPCGACRSVHIEANGEVRPCTQLQVDLGNATRGVAQAMRSEPARFIRSVRWEDLHGCRECELTPYCVRCFHTARAQGGDAMAPYEEACALAKTNFELSTGETARFVGSLGPFRETEAGVFEAFEATITEADRAMRERHGWIEGERTPAAARVEPGSQVSVSRPGRGTKRERVPLPVVP